MPRSISLIPNAGAQAHQVFQHHLAEKGIMTWRAGGQSMWPWVMPETQLYIVSCRKDELSLGTLVLFRRDNGFGLHRVVALLNEGVMTQGDAHACPDALVPFSDVVGRVRGVVLGRIVWKDAPEWLVLLTQRAAFLAAPRLRTSMRTLRAIVVRLRKRVFRPC